MIQVQKSLHKEIWNNFPKIVGKYKLKKSKLADLDNLTVSGKQGTAEVLNFAVPVLVLVYRLFTPYFYF